MIVDERMIKYINSIDDKPKIDIVVDFWQFLNPKEFVYGIG